MLGYSARNRVACDGSFILCGAGRFPVRRAGTTARRRSAAPGGGHEATLRRMARACSCKRFCATVDRRLPAPRARSAACVATTVRASVVTSDSASDCGLRIRLLGDLELRPRRRAVAAARVAAHPRVARLSGRHRHAAIPREPVRPAVGRPRRPAGVAALEPDQAALRGRRARRAPARRRPRAGGVGPARLRVDTQPSPCPAGRAAIRRRCRWRDLEAAALLLRGEFLDGLDLPACYRFHHWCLARREHYGGLRRERAGDA